MHRTDNALRRAGRRARLVTWLSLSLAVVVAGYAMPASASHVCNGCHAMRRELAAAYQQMPEPEAFAAPTAPTTSTLLNFDQSFDSVNYTLSPTQIRLRAGSHTLYKINADTGQIRKTRAVRFSTVRKYRAAHQLRTFGGHSYARITSGTWSGWYVRTSEAQGSSLTSFASSRQVRLAKGTHTGVRFYNSSRVNVRRSATLSAAATYDVSQRATFNNKVWFYVTNGPLANRWVARSTSVKLVSETDSGSTTTTVGPPATWNAVLLIYRNTDVTVTLSNGTNYRLKASISDSMYKLSRDVVNKFVKSAGSWSDNYAAMTMKVVDVPRTVTKLDTLSNGTYWLGPRTIAEDLAKYAPTGTYDSIFVLWQANDDKVRIPLGGWGLSLPPGPWANGAGYSSITTPGADWWWTDATNPQDIFIHEWLHQVIFFHEDAKRMKLDLHADAQYGYKRTNGTDKPWYRDVMRGLVKDGSSLLGVSYKIWRAGTPTRPNGW